MLPAAVGELCRVELGMDRSFVAEVIGFDRGVSQLMPYQKSDEIVPGATVIALGRKIRVPVGPALLGRVINGLGQPIDGRGPLRCATQVAARPDAPEPLSRPRIVKPFITGQRVIDGLLTLGRGQRVGLFAGSGVGKSTLLGEIAKGAESDLNVIVQIGERGREVRPFIEDCLGSKGLARSIVVVSTSDETPLMRVRAAETSVAIADYFRGKGANVLFLMDSLTRLATAQREIGLLRGEPPSARGYTPSVFQLLANVLERLGTSAEGSITGVLTVLVDGNDMDEPVSDAVRAMLDGHIILDRQMTEKGHFPAISVPQSLSRVMRDVADSEHQTAAQKLRNILATHAEVDVLIRVGAYAKGNSAQVDRAVALMPALQMFLRQAIETYSPFDETRQAMAQIAAAWPY